MPYLSRSSDKFGIGKMCQESSRVNSQKCNFTDVKTACIRTMTASCCSARARWAICSSVRAVSLFAHSTRIAAQFRLFALQKAALQTQPVELSRTPPLLLDRSHETPSVTVWVESESGGLGFAVAPANFGPLSNTLLVSNNTKTGTINGFNLTTGKFVDTVKNSLGKPIFINGISSPEL